MTIHKHSSNLKFRIASTRAQLGSLFVASLMTLGVSAMAQDQQVSVVNLKVVRNMAGGQSVITPKGDLAPLPGSGVSGDVAQIFFGSQGGFWYVDQSGKTIDLASTVKDLQARRAQLVPQYAPIASPVYAAPPTSVSPAPPMQNNYSEQSANNQSVNYAQSQNYNQSQSSGSGHSGAVGSAATAAVAAAGGAALGAAMSNGYYNVPYGTPMYYRNGNPYYYRDGDHREIEDLNENQKAVLVNKRRIENQQQEQLVQQRQANQQERQSNQQSRQDQWQQKSNEHQESFNRQQQWYQNEMKQNPGRFERSSENPFASREDRGGSAQARGNRNREDFQRGSRQTGSFERRGVGGRRGR